MILHNFLNKYLENEEFMIAFYECNSLKHFELYGTINGMNYFNEAKFALADFCFNANFGIPHKTIWN